MNNQKTNSSEWEKISRITSHEDFFHKYVIHPEMRNLTLGSENRVIADFGCGNGIFLQQVLPSFKKGYAIDKSLAMLKVARQNIKHNNVSFIQNDVTHKLPINDGECDVVTQILLLHTVPQIEEIIEESNRILKEKGFCIVVMPHPLAVHKGYFISLQDFDKDEYKTTQSARFIWHREDKKAMMEFYIRPLSDIINMFLKYFDLSYISEPVAPKREEISGKIIESTVDSTYNEKLIFDRMRKEPSFLFLKFEKNEK